MITAEELIQYCSQKQLAYIDYPFGPKPVCYKINGKIFAEIYIQEGNRKITLKCEPSLADFYRQQFPGIVVRGYYCPPSQQPHRNTIWFENFEKDILLEMIDHSYEEVIKSFSRKVQSELLNNQDIK